MVTQTSRGGAPWDGPGSLRSCRCCYAPPISAAADPADCPWFLTGVAQDLPAQQLPASDSPQGWWVVLTQGEGDAELVLAVPESTPAGGSISVFYRLIAGAGEAPCSMNLWAAGEEPPTPQGLETSPGWHVCSFDRDGPLPAGKLTLRLSCAQGVVVQLLLPHSAAPWPTPQGLLRLLGQQCAANEAHEDARIAYEGVARLVPGTGEAATALRGAGDSAQAAGDASGAVESYLAALEQCGSDGEGWQAFGESPGYAQNREAADLETGLRARLARIAADAPPEAAGKALLAAADQYPPSRGSRAAVLACARAESAAGRDPAPFAVLLLDQSGDHDGTKAKLRLPENQVHLDAIGTPTDPTALTEAVGMLLAASGENLAAPALEGLVTAWLAGERGGLSRDEAACRAGFEAAAKLGAETCAPACARVRPRDHEPVAAVPGVRAGG